jgi:hypothetical protein
MKVTVCGSETTIGLYHVTLSPALISTFLGIYESHKVPLPPAVPSKSDDT